MFNFTPSPAGVSHSLRSRRGKVTPIVKGMSTAKTTRHEYTYIPGIEDAGARSCRSSSPLWFRIQCDRSPFDVFNTIRIKRKAKIGTPFARPGDEVFDVPQEGTKGKGKNIMEKTGHENLYEVLQVSQRAHPLIITKAFRLLAALYHPDNKKTGDPEAFKRSVEAYRVLSDPLRRSMYDRETLGAMGSRAGAAGFTDDPLLPPPRRCTDERELRELILRALYDVRRGRPYQPGLSLMVLSELFGCAIDDLQFPLWYLRGKRLIETSDDSEVVITVDGVEHLETMGHGTNGSGANRRIEEILSLPLPRDLAIGWMPDCEISRNGHAKERTSGDGP
jgi:curved DNA-binding protein